MKIRFFLALSGFFLPSSTRFCTHHLRALSVDACPLKKEAQEDQELIRVVFFEESMNTERRLL